jgi:hypothetical protein
MRYVQHEDSSVDELPKRLLVFIAQEELHIMQRSFGAE